MGQQAKGGLSRRGLLKAAGLAGAGLVLAPTILVRKAGAGEQDFYHFINKTNGKWKNSEIFWSKHMMDEWHSVADSPTAPNGGNGRMYFYVGKQPKNPDDWEAYWDFIEYNSHGTWWAGNTTQVDAWCLPITIEMGSKKYGCTGPRTKMFEDFKKNAPKAFQNCILNGDKWITSPFRADLGEGKPFANYFEPYVDQVWKMYEKETKTPSGKYIGKADPGGALVFRPADDSVKFAGDPKGLTCASKPTTKNILLGDGVLSSSPSFCAAFNRGIAEDPADWRDTTKFYQKEPCNWYSKFLHKYSVDHKAYGFCYDDYAEQAAYFQADADHMDVTFYWD
jgi:hypothetical protein